MAKECQRCLTMHAEDMGFWKTLVFMHLCSPSEAAQFDHEQFIANYFLDMFKKEPCPGKGHKLLVLGQVDQEKIESRLRALCEPFLGLQCTPRTGIQWWAGNPTLSPGWTRRSRVCPLLVPSTMFPRQRRTSTLTVFSPNTSSMG